MVAKDTPVRGHLLSSCLLALQSCSRQRDKRVYLHGLFGGIGTRQERLPEVFCTCSIVRCRKPEEMQALQKRLDVQPDLQHVYVSILGSQGGSKNEVDQARVVDCGDWTEDGNLVRRIFRGATNL